MKIRGFLMAFVLTVMSISVVYGAFEERGVGSAYLGLGGTGLAGGGLSFIVFRNAAALPFYAEKRVDLFYRNFYGIPDLNEVALGFTLPLKSLPVSLGLTQYGSKTYNESQIRIGVAYRVSSSVALGITGNLYYLSLKNYGYSTSAGFGLSGLYTVSNRLNLGFVVNNLNEPVIGAAREKIPLTMMLGLSYSPAEGVIFNTDLVKETDVDFDYRFGLEYVALDWLILRAGFRTLTKKLGFGLGLFLGRLRIDYSLENHPDLNVSHSVSVGYAL